MIGIYKITSPTKKVYIGQSVDIEKRLKKYKILDCKRQLIIYNSLKKHGVEKHKFEIICECDISELNEKERYYQDLYCVLGKGGLNCRLTKSSDRSGLLSEETKEKCRKASTGKKASLETILKMKAFMKGKYLGVKKSEDHKKKIGLSNLGKNLGKKHSKETKSKMSIAKKGKMKDSHKEKLRVLNIGNKYSLGRKISDLHKEKISKKILDTKTGIIYKSIKSASIELCIKYSTLKYQTLKKTRFVLTN